MSVKSLLKRPVIIFSLVVCAAAVIIFTRGFAVEAGNTNARTALAPTITATNNDALIGDADGDGRADPGDTVEYTVTVTNNGTDASNVNFSDTLDLHQTYVGGSVNTTPIAVNDSYSVYGNVNMVVPDGATDLLSNDINPDNGSQPSITPGTFSSAICGGCGNVVVSANGSFTYDPPVGYTGADTFIYTVTGTNGLTATATVTLNVSGMIWFIDNNAPTCTVIAAQCGKFSKPFSSLDAFRAVNNGAGLNPKINQDIFIYQSATSYPLTATFPLLDGQRLIGQDASPNLTPVNTLLGITLPTGSATLPLTDTGGNSVLITGAGFSAPVGAATTATIRGVSISATSAAKITGNVFGTLTLGDITLGGTGKALDLTSGAVAIPAGVTNSFTSIASTSSGNQGISFAGITGTLVSGGTTITGATTQGILIGTSTANINFGNTSVAAGTDSISFQNNSGGTKTFGTLSTTNGTGISFLHAVGGGAVTVSGAATFTNPGGSCIDIQDSTNAVTFAGVTCNASAGTGVFLDDNTGNVTFAALNIDTDANVRAFQATAGNTGTITTTSGTIADTGTATAVDIVGTSAASTTPLNIQFTSISQTGGTSGIILTNTSASGSPGGFRVIGNGGTCTSSASCTGGAIVGTGSMTSAILLTNANTTAFDRIFIQTTTDSGVKGTTSANFSFTNGKIDNSGTGLGAETSNIAFNTTAAGTENNISGTLTITGNTLTNAYYHGIDIFNFNGTISDANISNNTITSSVQGGTAIACGATPATCSKGTGIRFVAFGSASTVANVTKATINGNTITNFPAANGILASGGNGNAAGTGGTFGTNAANPIAIQNNILSGASATNRFGAFGMATTNNGRGTAFFNIHNNSISNSTGTGLSISSFGFAVTTAVVTKNTIVANNSVAAQGIGAGTSQTFNANDTPTLNIRIGDGTAANQNNISQTDGNGILVTARDCTSKTNARILTNTVAKPLGGLREGIRVDAGNGVSVDDEVNLEISGNTSSGSTSGANTAPGIGLRKQGTVATTNDFKIVGLPAGSTASPNVENYVSGQNPGSLAGNFGFGGTDLISATSGFSVGTAMTFRPGEEDAVNTSGDSQNVSSLLNSSYQTPSEILATLEPIYKHSAVAETISNELIAQASAEAISTVKERAEMSGANYLAAASTFFGEVTNKLGAAISPTAYAQTSDDTAANNQSKQLSGETVTVSGAGAGFTLPAGKSITIKFRATIDNVAGLTQVSNQGTVSGSNFSNVVTDDPATGAANDATITLIDSTTVTVTSSQNPSITGQSVTFTATLTGAPVHAAGDPGGTVQFFDNGVAVGSPATVAAGAVNDNTGTATLTLSDLTAGSHPITATFGGGGTGAGGFNANNTSTTVSQVVSNTAIWNGATSAAWTLGTNWTTNAAPSLATNDVSIPAAGVTNNPTISASDVSVNNITLSAGRTLTINTSRVLNVGGTLTLSGNNILGGSAGTVAIGAIGSVVRTSGSIETNLRKNYTAASSKTFEVGTTNGYSPATINLTAGTFPLDFTVRANQGSHPTLGAGNNLKRYWTVTPAGGAPTATMTFNYLDPLDITGTEANYRLVRINGGTPYVYPNLPSVTYDRAANTATISGTTQFSDWTLADLAPTSASVSIGGRVLDVNNLGIGNAQITLVDSQGNIRLARTNPFGYYRFYDIPVGETYTLSAGHKQHEFMPRVLSVEEDSQDIDFVANP
jgi:hypothetical protein